MSRNFPCDTPNYISEKKEQQAIADGLCPKCGRKDVSGRHHNGTFAVPECDYKECNVCNYQWGYE